MSGEFEGYERKYCHLSAKLSKACIEAAAINGGTQDCFSSLLF